MGVDVVGESWNGQGNFWGRRIAVAPRGDKGGVEGLRLGDVLRAACFRCICGNSREVL